ncbi:F-box associated domain type 1 [Arabidopsis thaliana x Arabidopsis arenosa]|uniref:F-box associated domain type 1 n=1 Tax=Arabidopsis thaliana x Arabidopsis arenosa TaxID=1240361 RepID=A0A8T2AAW0_9BRAS|nr:F-box associated domain type 1 [Arabidopsis thaliana x Arabidopsis arenosa]
MDLIPYDVVEHILERLDVKTLLKFKFVSKQWKSTIQCRAFQERQLMHRRQSGNPDVLLVSVCDESYPIGTELEAMRTLVVGSSVSVRILTPWEKTLYKVCQSSCDGLICLYNDYPKNIVVNPTTRWHRTFPRSTYQRLTSHGESWAKLGFGKDKINGTYKPVWLYNSAELGGLNDDDDNNNTSTICEVFDFTSKAWRYVVPASPYPILPYQDPVYVDGSLHWLTAGETTNVLSFDLHTETFQVMSKAPFLHHHDHSNRELVMCNLDDRLCVSEKKWPNQVIWSLDSDHKTWKEIYSIDLNITSFWFGKHRFALTPLAVVDKDKLLFCEPNSGDQLLTHDPKTKSYELAYISFYRTTAYPLCYFQSLLSIL